MDKDARWNFETLEGAMVSVQEYIYRIASEMFGELERRDLIVGNSHHIAQSLALDAKMTVRARWNYNNKEYDKRR